MNEQQTTKKLLAIMAVIFVSAVLVTLPYQNQVANAAPSIKRIEVTGGGDGKWQCSGEQSSLFLGILDMAATVDKVTGKLSGTWQITQSGSEQVSGTITDGKVKGNSFTLSGSETSGSGSACGPLPISATITGQCGTDVVVFLDARSPEQVQTASFPHVSVSCTK